MTSDIDMLSEMWLTVKAYIPQKDRQAVADHVVSVVADHSITEDELRKFGGTDVYLRQAVKEYLGDDEDADDDYDEYDDE